MSRRLACLALGLAALAAGGCASTAPGNPADPWERVNRPVFHFNDRVDTYVLRPVAQGWTFITFEGMRDSVARFYYNARFPSRFVSSFGQGEAEKGLNELGRFLVNSSVGVGGLFDPASEFGFPHHDEDIGQMFGRWGIPPGPYWVIPFFGPSDPRDAAGMVGDMLLNPLTWFVRFSGVLNVINSRAIAEPQIANAKKTALDYYVFVRDAFLQNREAAVADRAEGSAKTSGPYDDLYELPAVEE